MGIALMSMSLGSLFGPLQAAVEWLAGGAPAPRARHGRETRPSPVGGPGAATGATPGAAPVSIAGCVRQARASGQFGMQKPRSRPLRVLRVVDAAHPSASAGRMVISGRMADVCAELDRLAAQEAASR